MRVKLAKFSFYIQAQGDSYDVLHSGDVGYVYRIGTVYSHDISASSGSINIQIPQSENKRYGIFASVSNDLVCSVNINTYQYGSSSVTNSLASRLTTLSPLGIICRSVVSIIVDPTQGSGRLTVLVCSTFSVSSETRITGGVVVPELDIRQDPQGGDPIIIIGSGGSSSSSNPFTGVPTRLGDVPIGGIVWWSGIFNTSNVYSEPVAISSNFKLCDGSLITDPESPLFGYKVPNLIGKSIAGAENYQEQSSQTQSFNEAVDFLFGFGSDWNKPAELVVSGQTQSAALYLAKPYMRIK